MWHTWTPKLVDKKAFPFWKRVTLLIYSQFWHVCTLVVSKAVPMGTMAPTKAFLVSAKPENPSTIYYGRASLQRGRLVVVVAAAVAAPTIVIITKKNGLC